MAKRQLLRDRASHRETDDMGARDLERFEQRRGVVGDGGADGGPSSSGVRPTPRLSKAVTR